MLSILEVIRPQRKKEEISINEMEEKGFVNFLIKCSASANDKNDEDHIIVRVFGPLPFHRESEVLMMKKLSEKGMIPPLYCKFKNGVSYQYAPGKCLTREQLKDEKILRMLAEKIHTIHGTDVQSWMAGSGRPSVRAFISAFIGSEDMKVPRFEGNEEKQLKCKQCLPSMEQLDTYKHECYDIYDDLAKRSPSVFGHFDLQPSNIIYDATRDKLVFIDWECRNVGPEIIDVAIVISRDLQFTGIFTDSASMKQWLNIYLSTHPSCSNQPLQPDTLHTWYKNSILASILISFLAFAYFIAHIEKATDALPLDYFGLTIKAYERFMVYRKELQMLDVK